MEIRGNYFLKSYLSFPPLIRPGLIFQAMLVLSAYNLMPATIIAKTGYPVLPPDTIFIDIGCIGDKELFTRFGGLSDSLAETEAKYFMATIINRVANKYEPIFNLYDPVNKIYKFRIVTNDVIKDNFPLYSGFLKNEVVWGNHKDFWESKYPCADDLPDIIHVFSGHSVGQLTTPSGKSFYGWSQGTIYYNLACLLGNSITLHGLTGGSNGINQDSFYNLSLATHEIGHDFGLVHLEDGPCGTLCSNAAYLMCESNNYSMQLSTCDYPILESTLTNTTIVNCLKPAVQATVDSNCMHCQVTIMAMADTDVLAFGCDGYENFEFSTEVWNNCDATGRRIRLEFNKNALEVVDPGIFTASEAGSLMELRILDSTGQEVPEMFGSEEKKTFTVRLKIKDVSGLTITSLFVRTRVFSLAGGQLAFKEKPIHYAVQAGASPSSTINSLPTIETAVLLNAQLDISSPSQFDNKNIRYIFCAPGAGIQVNNQKTVFRTVQILGCSSMWKGITVNSGSALELDMSFVRDAQFGLSLQKGATLIAKNSWLLDNNFALKTHHGGTGNYSITLFGNRFGTTEAGLKAAYAGQTPAPAGKGFTGLYLKDAGSVVMDGDTLGNEPNRFFNLKYGIISDNTELRVYSAIFEDITQVAKGSGYAGYAPGLTGRAVYARNGTVWIAGAFEGQELAFQNCHTGVETLDATAYVWRTAMIGVTNGVVTTNGNYAIHQYNDIEASDRGIELRYASPLWFPTSSGASAAIGGIYRNTITMTGKANAAAISLAGDKMIGVDPTGSLSGPPLFTGGNIAGNTITLNDGARGINVNVARKLAVWDNHISLNTSQADSRGIALNAGDQNTLSCNTVTGAGSHTGLYALHTDRARLLCNLSDGMGAGLRVAGVLMGKNKADIAGNIFQDNAAGLLYGTDAISGPQIHRGNRWAGSGTMAEHQGIPDVAIQSKYTVDKTENPEFLPDVSIPQNWFQDIQDTAPSYTCPGQPGSCIKTDSIVSEEPDQFLDEKTARGELPGTDYQSPNIWLAQRRLYERIIEEGNPYSGNPDISAFLASAQTNGIAAYAALQTGMRQTLTPGGADRDSLLLYEGRILDGLDSLARLERQLYAPGTGEQDSLDLSEQRAALRSAIQQWASARSVLLGIIDSLRAIAADTLLTQNATLPDLETPYADHEKTVNDIELRTVMHGIFTIEAQDSLTLEAIAALCPLSAGEAVLRARALLTLAWETPQWYDDEAACLEERGQRASKPAPAVLRVYPNPATNGITVEYAGGRNAERQTFLLFNSLGQPVKTVVLPAEQNTTRVLLHDLPAGLYWYQVNGGQIAVRTSKIVVNR